MNDLDELRAAFRADYTVPKRRRSTRAVNNDLRLREALLEVITQRGWDGVTMAGLASHADFSPTVVRARAHSVAELGNDLWQHTLGPAFATAVTSTLDGLRTGDDATIVAALRCWTKPSAELQATVEMLVASMFDHELAPVVSSDARRILDQAFDDTDSHRRAADVVMTGIMFAFALGYHELVRDVAEVHVPFTKGLYQTLEQAEPTPVPPLPPDVTWTRALATDDPYDAAIVLATMDVLATRGYRRATMARITERAGVSVGAVTARHADKAHLVAHAARTMLLTPAEMDAAFEALRAELGDAVTQTMWVRELLRADHRTLWGLRLDLALKARREEALAEFTAHTITGPYYGYMLLACLVDGLDELPLLGPISNGLRNYHDHI